LGWERFCGAGQGIDSRWLKSYFGGDMKTITAIFLCIMGCLISAQNSFALTIAGLADPYGIAVDSKSGAIFVSNMAGEPDVKDDNGFITRLKPDGTVDQIRFIDGTKNNIVLNSPKGMAVMGNFLYVCDIDAIRVFNVESGIQLFEVNFGDLPRQNFYAITVGPDGALYAADAVVNRIYRIDLSKQHEVTLFTEGGDLQAPHGIVWSSSKQGFVVTANAIGQVITYDRSAKRMQTPPIFLKSPEGVDVDDGGNIYVADRDLKSVYRISPNFALYSFAQGIERPAGIAYNRGTKNMMVSVFGGNTVEVYPVAQ
jgi:DNA-binding beta-propeller fold protein YncE